MSKKVLLIVTLYITISGCVSYTLVPAGKSQNVQGMAVAPLSSWTATPYKPGANATVWTKDGVGLNELIFIGDVGDGKSIFKSVSKELPMPTYKKDMLPNEIVELVETSIKNNLGGQVSVESSNLRPQSVNGNDGFRFDLKYFTGGGLYKQGDVIAISKNETLNLIIYTAAALHYFPKDHAEINSLFSNIEM